MAMRWSPAVARGSAPRWYDALQRKAGQSRFTTIIPPPTPTRWPRQINAAGGRAVTLAGDLGKIDSFADLFGRANAGWGFCSLLVNNASAFEYDDVSNVTRANLEHLFAVNHHAPVLLAKDFREQLREGSKGLIVNVLDQKVFNLNPDFFSYTLTKSALESATRLLAMAMAPDVRVCGIAPGLTLRSGEQTEEGFRLAHRKTPLGIGSKPEDIAEALSFLTKVPSITGDHDHRRWRPAPAAAHPRHHVQLRHPAGRAGRQAGAVRPIRQTPRSA